MFLASLLCQFGLCRLEILFVRESFGSETHTGHLQVVQTPCTTPDCKKIKEASIYLLQTIFQNFHTSAAIAVELKVFFTEKLNEKNKVSCWWKEIFQLCRRNFVHCLLKCNQVFWHETSKNWKINQSFLFSIYGWRRE